MKKIRVTEQSGRTTVIEVPDYMSIRDGKLYNHNTEQFEFVEGDIINVSHDDGFLYAEKVVDHTDFQIVPTNVSVMGENKCYVLSTEGGRTKTGIWRSRVEEVA